MDDLSPVAISDVELSQWSERLPLMLRLAAWWSAHGPRGRGAVPRVLGRTFGRRWKAAIRTRMGELLAVDPGCLDIYTTIMREGDWDPWVLKGCLAALRAREVFFDVGANAGCMAVAVASRRPDVKVFAFEPQPNLARAVAISARLNRLENLVTYGTALAERSATIDLYIPSHAIHASQVSREAGARVISCRAVALDEEIKAGRLPHPHVIKIDVEGAELSVLQGCAALLKERAPVVVFESDVNSLRFGYSQRDIMAWLTSRSDYVFFRLSPSDLLAAHRTRSQEFGKLYLEYL